MILSPIRCPSLTNNFVFIIIVSTSSHDSSQVSLLELSFIVFPESLPLLIPPLLLLSFVELLNQLLAAPNAAPITTDARPPRLSISFSLSAVTKYWETVGSSPAILILIPTLGLKSNVSARNGMEHTKSNGTICLLRCWHFQRLYFTSLFTSYAPSNKSFIRTHTILPSRYNAHKPFSRVSIVSFDMQHWKIFNDINVALPFWNNLDNNNSPVMPE